MCQCCTKLYTLNSVVEFILSLIFSESSTEPTSPLNSEGITVTKLSNGSAVVTCNTSGQSCLALFLSTTSLDQMVVGFINSSSDRTTLNSTFDVFMYVVVYTWNSASGETIFDGQVSFISRLELPISKLRVSFSFRIACVLFLLLQLLPLHNHLLTVRNLHRHCQRP